MMAVFGLRSCEDQGSVEPWAPYDSSATISALAKEQAAGEAVRQKAAQATKELSGAAGCSMSSCMRPRMFCFEFSLCFVLCLCGLSIACLVVCFGTDDNQFYVIFHVGGSSGQIHFLATPTVCHELEVRIIYIHTCKTFRAHTLQFLHP